MGNLLQDRNAAVELASAEQVIEIADKISSFERLVTIVESDLAALEPDKLPPEWRESTIRGQLQFGFADHERRVPMLQGSAAVTVAAVCQRCLEPFRLRLDVEPKLLLLGSDDVVTGFEEFEVWELTESTIRPQDVVEELLVMAMPFSAMHDNIVECKSLASNSNEDEDSEELVRPFAALRAQMSQNEDGSD